MGVFTTGRQVALEIDMPGWWLANSSVDMDFRRGLYYDSSTANPRTANTFLSCSRASTGYAKNVADTWIAFGNDELRITDLGLLVEDSRTNNLLNSDAPATQTTASLATGNYTLWVEGTGSALASGGTATITGASSATSGSPNVFTVTVAGTVTVTVTGTLTRFQLELGAFPSSFILTAGAAATRAQDKVLCTGTLNNLIGISTGTLIGTCLVDVQTIATLSGSARIIGQSDTTNNTILYRSSDTVVGFYNGSINPTPTLGNSLTFLTGAKVAVGFDEVANTLSICGGGGTVTPRSDMDTIATTGASVGFSTGGASEQMYGYYRRLTAWNSKLADATLQALTAP